MSIRNETAGQGRYDYILVGGGSSACVVAAGLVESGARVLMLERGPRKSVRSCIFPPAT